MKIELTTLLPTIALRRTFFNIIHHPTCLLFPNTSSWSGSVRHSYQKFWSFICSEFELQRKRQVIDDADDSRSKERVVYDRAIQLAAPGPNLVREGLTVGPRCSAKILKTIIRNFKITVLSNKISNLVCGKTHQTKAIIYDSI